jgi:hypothetical protein
MSDNNDLSEIMARCDQVTSSPYIRRVAPIELANLRDVLERIRLLTTEDVPALMSEIRRLRSQNRKIQEGINTLSHQQADNPPMRIEEPVADLWAEEPRGA